MMENMDLEKAIFDRTHRLVGSAVMSALSKARVIIFGVGGVGSWCAESLVRSGIRHLTIVDSDRVCVSNINRQLMANVGTVGEVKVDALRRHLLAINPVAEVRAVRQVYCQETADSFAIGEYDYVIDCIDSLKNKVLLIENATAAKVRFFSSMGAALKLDPTRVKVAEFGKVAGCPLARALRERFKRKKRFPRRKFLCVYSDEVLPNLGSENMTDVDSMTIVRDETVDGRASFRLADTGVDDAADPGVVSHDWNASKAQINGTLMHVTAMFGLTLGGLVIKDVYTKTLSDIKNAGGTQT